MLKLNFALYSSATLLRDWWKQVKAHFTEVQDAHNALETRLGEESERLDAAIAAESTARQNGDSALSSRINSEKQGRESADSVLRQSIADKTAELSKSISDKATELYEAIKDEAKDRANADAQLTAQLSAEATARQNADGRLENRIGALEGKSHTHENADVLGGITADDVAAWRDKTDFDTENKLMIAYLFELLKGYSTDLNAMYGAAGVTLYDGGFAEDSDTDEVIIIDGGDFEEADTAALDFGTFEESALALSQVLDGGRY